MNLIFALFYGLISSVHAFTVVKQVVLPPYQYGAIPATSLRAGQTVPMSTKVTATQGKIVFKNNNGEFTGLGPFELEFQPDDSVKINYGKVLVNATVSVPKKLVKTREVTITAKASRFIASYFVTLLETELIAYDGQVELVDDKNKGEKKIIKKTEWLGLGGRFGQKVSGPVTLPPDGLNFYSQDFNLR